ncbi:MAG: peptide deformylase [Candidatus Roizmanbacteria bacterium]|nr:MAG: peptide deformylase [Candidatus Roizmanbacteria bacterium]
MIKIVTVPNSVLNSPAQPVTKIDDKIKNLVYDMEEVLIAQIDPQGVGLAAPQVGISLQIFLIKPERNQETEVFINPKILEVKTQNPSPTTQNVKSPKDKLEGCLSIPRIWGPVKRANKVKLQYQTLAGETKTQWFTGLKAAIIQHEMDHLNGILFTQKALEQKTPLYEEENGEFTKVNY